MPKITCPHCKRNLNVPEKHAGQAVKCPACHGAFQVPSSEPVLLSPEAVMLDPPPPPPMPTSPPPLEAIVFADEDSPEDDADPLAFLSKPTPPTSARRMPPQQPQGAPSWIGNSGTPRQTSKACPMCGEQILAVALKCKHCGSTFSGMAEGVKRGSSATASGGNRIAAGILGILLGSLGIHKFILGLTTPGIIMLLVTLLTCGWGGLVTGLIGLVEGIIYLSKNDEDFYQTYIVGKREWF